MIGGELVACDMELAAWTWAKQNMNISAAVNGQVHFDVPGRTPPFPLITLRRVGGGPQRTDGLIDDAVISFSCWAKPYDKATSARVASVLVTEAFNLFRAPAVLDLPGVRVTLYGAQVGGALWLPEPQSGEARHIVDVTFTSTANAV